MWTLRGTYFMSRHLHGTWNFQVAPPILENLCTPVLQYLATSHSSMFECLAEVPDL